MKKPAPQSSSTLSASEQPLIVESSMAMDILGKPTQERKNINRYKRISSAQEDTREYYDQCTQRLSRKSWRAFVGYENINLFSE